MVMRAFHRPIDHVLFDRFGMPVELRSRLPYSARGALLDLEDRAGDLECECGLGRVLSCQVWLAGSVVTARLSCRAHAGVFVDVSIMLLR